MNRDDKRLGAEVFRRRVDLGFTGRRALAAAAGVGKRTVDSLESGESVSEATLYKVEKVLQWQPGSAAAILEGGSPIEVQDDAPEPTPRGAANVDALAAMLLDTHERDGFFAFRDMLDDLERRHDAGTMQSIKARYNELASGEVGETHHA